MSPESEQSMNIRLSLFKNQVCFHSGANHLDHTIHNDYDVHKRSTPNEREQCGPLQTNGSIVRISLIAMGMLEGQTAICLKESTLLLACCV